MKASLQVMQLEDRLTPAVTASFGAGGILTVTGDRFDNSVVVGDFNTDGIIDVTSNGQAVAVLGGVPQKGLTALIVIDLGAGNDSALVTNGVDTRDAAGNLLRSPDTRILLGSGNDVSLTQNGGIVNGLAGVAANGVVIGPVVGNSFVDAGSGNDFVDSGLGNDIIFLGSGDDTYRWKPGTLTDQVDGGSGFDTSIVVGNDGAGDAFTLFVSANGDVVFQRTNLVQFSIFHRKGTVESVVLQPGSGDDSVSVGNLDGAGVKRVLVDGGAGRDSVSVARQRQASILVVPDQADPPVTMLDAFFFNLGQRRGRR